MWPRFKKGQTFVLCNQGYLINAERVSPIETKVEVIINLLEPNKVSELKAFLGMLNHYHRHLLNLSTILELLHGSLRKGAKWKWQDRQKQIFKNTKMMLCSSKLLVHYEPSKDLVVSCATSPYGIRAVISHTMPDGSERSIAYASKAVSTAERNYAQIKKERLAVVFALRKFHQYLYGHRFTIFTDHKLLLGLIVENKAVPPLAAARIPR